MKLGIVTPVLTRLPGAHAAWEESAGIAEVEQVVTAAERLGYDFCTCSEHIAVPVDAATTRGATYWDPLPTFGYLAAHTTRIRLATFVLVLGYHHPLAIVKRYGTLDAISGGRLVLGVGVGSLGEEFELLGARFDDRGEIADEAIVAIRDAWAQPVVDGFVIDPVPVQPYVPIWVGGRTYRSLRRAVALGDGWCPFGLRTAELGTMLERVRSTEGWTARRRRLDIVVQNERPLDPAGEPDRVAGQLGRYDAIGATGLAARFVHHSPAHYIEQLEALSELSPASR